MTQQSPSFDVSEATLRFKGAVMRGYLKKTNSTNLEAAEVFFTGVYIRAMSSVYETKVDVPFYAWLKKLARCEFAKHAADGSRQPVPFSNFSSGSNNPGQAAPGVISPPSKRVRRAEDAGRLHAAIATLAPSFQVVAKELCLQDGLKGRELANQVEVLARRLGVTVAGIYKIRMRLYQKLKPLLGSESDNFSG